MKKFIIFLSLISESETNILYRFITHRVKYFKPLFIAILMIMAYRQWNPKIQCLRKLEYYIRSIKKGYFKQKCQASENMFISMHSILGWASFCMNYCISAAWHGGNQPVALLRCNGSPGCFIAAFRSSALLGLVSLIFLLTIPQRFTMEFLMNWLQLQFTPCEALPSVWISFAWHYSQACGHPCCLCTLPYPFLPSSQLFI